MRSSCRIACGVLLLAAVAARWTAAQSTEPADTGLLTVAERTGFQETSTSAQVVELMDRLGDMAPHVHRWNIGTTVEGRPLAAAVVAWPHVSSPQDLRDDDRLVAVLLGNIHSGECDGKEALLMLLRELAEDRDHPLLKDLVLVFVPNYNADANDRMGPDHRPGQIGPNQMGVRENVQGLDLNRDFVKLDSPEARALVSLIDRWNPHLFIDTHTTNGSRHRYALTYDIPHNPASAKGPRELLRKEMMPEVSRRLKQRNINTFFYGNFDRGHTTWTTYGHEPRYSTEYLGLRGRLGILAESHSYIPYQERIEATKAFVEECLKYAGERRPHVARVLRRAQQDTRAAGKTPLAGDMVPIRAKLAAFPDKVVVEGYGPDGKQPKDYEVQFFGRFDGTQSVERPFAYLIPFHESRVADRLRMHGIQLQQLVEDVELDLEVYRATKLQSARQPFQDHRMVTADVQLRSERRKVPAGTYVAFTGQPLGNLLVYLLEPGSDDGLVTWNFFDHVWNEGEDYPVTRIAAPAKFMTMDFERVVPAQKLDLDQIYGSRRFPTGGSFGVPSWLPDSSNYLVQDGSRRYQVDAATGARRRYDDPMQNAAAAFKSLPGIKPEEAESLASRGQSSPDGKAILVSFANDLFYYKAGEKQARRLTEGPDNEMDATFSPDGRLVAFTRNHNLFVVEVESGVERALTEDGSDQILNGRLDWVYQEELYGRGNYQGFWWSPDSTRLAFLQLNEEPVHRYTLPDTIPYRQTLEVTPYPKAGDPLPTVRLGVVRAAGGNVLWMDDYRYSADDWLISRVDWGPEGREVVYQVQNREQTWLHLTAADANSGQTRLLLSETSPAWINVHGPPYFLKDGSFLWLSERSGHLHLYHVTDERQDTELAAGNGDESNEENQESTGVRPVTSGDWAISSYYGIDPKEEWIYFSATRQNNIAAEICRVRLDGSELQSLSSEAGHHTARFNDDYTYFFDSFSTAHNGQQTSLRQADGTLVRIIHPFIDDYLKYFATSEPEIMTVPARDGVLLDAMLIKPASFDPQKKYPVLVYAYSGPQSPTVRNRWGGSTYLWHQYFAQQGYCVWMCDNRSASYRGADEAWPIHRKLGVHELQDIEDGLKWLKSHPWIDAERIGIWGWSYGGYMASYALTHSQSFKVGIAGAPVTDWRNYDAIYTERYMGLPQTNPEGYKVSSVTEAAANLHGRLLIIHGTQDDNVHPGNSLQLVHELQKAGKQFDLMLYPKNRHGITQPAQSRHLRELMTEFILERL